jgi:hypothetical protein
MLNNIITSRAFQLFIPIIVALFTTGFLRLQLFSGLPEADGGVYTLASQYIYFAISNFEDLKGTPLYLYSLMTSWVYGLEVNQFILLRLIDGLVAIAASIVLFKVILKESGSTLFTVILATGLFIIMNNIEIVLYGFRNAIWAAFLPLFSALLIWQNSTQEDKYSFYLIGALVSFGVLLREPFLVFFILACIAILIGYGCRILLKYLIGSAVLGFTVLGLILMLRDWDLFNLVNAYIYGGTFYQPHKSLTADFFIFGTAYVIKTNWFIFTTATISILYLVKSYFSNKKIINMQRVYFWLAVILIAFLEPYFKIGFPYHFANCLPGLAGLSALGWRYITIQESKKIQLILMILISILSLMIILPTINKQIVQNNRIFSLSEAHRWVMAPDSFRSKNMVVRSQYLIAAAKIYELSRENSTLATTGNMAVLFPLTGLMPTSYKTHELHKLFMKLNYDEDKLIKILEQHRPTIILSSQSYGNEKEKAIPIAIEKTNLYHKVETIVGNKNLVYGWKFKQPGIIYRLKDFK